MKTKNNIMRYSLIMAFALLITFAACKSDKTTTKEETEIPPSSITQKDGSTVKTVTGTVLETSPILDFGGGLWIYMVDEKEEEFYFDFYRSENPAKYDKLTDDLLEVKMQAFYKVNKEQVAIDIQTLGMIGSKANRDYKNMKVYTIKGKQTGALENGDGFTVTLETDKGTVLKFSADEEVYFGAEPASYNGKQVQIVYTEEEQLLLTDYEIIPEN